MPPPLYVDCGFARVAMYEYSKEAQRINKESRVTSFRALFKPVQHFADSDSYFHSQGRAQSRFDKHCTLIVAIFKKGLEPTRK